ncbi:hypothetical protein HDU91_004161 [Kappamyces sp. JEL0680]|nr:hypothetical protein HDU91_004161 [Kappamyces sp. JEL0680]
MLGLEQRRKITRHKYSWSHNQELSPVIDDCIDLIHSLLQRGPVLIHCQQGISRSVALVIAYLMKTQQLSCLEAYTFVRSKASHISPNVNLVSQKQSIFAHRAYKHVNDFIRVFISFKDGTGFALILDINNTIEYVARQIEAEASIRSIEKSPDLQDVQSGKVSFADVMTRNSSGVSKTIDVYQLYDSGNLAIPFSSKVKDVLSFDDEIFPMTSAEEEIFDTESSVEFLKSDISGSAFVLNESMSSSQALDRGNTIFSTTDDRLLSVLHNTASLQFFNEFCLQEYSIENVLFWIEAEIYRSIVSAEARKSFARHLYLNYLKLGSPLCLNVDAEVRESVRAEIENEPSENLFEDVQGFIYILIKQHAYNRFEASDLFKRFLAYKQKDRYGYTQGKTQWNYDALVAKLGPDYRADMELFVHVLENPSSDDAAKVLRDITPGQIPALESPLFRQTVLLKRLSHYFTDQRGIADKQYFDNDGRRAWASRHRQVQKQKRLTKFFGIRPTSDQMQQQSIPGRPSVFSDLGEEYAINIISEIFPEAPEIDKRKKAEKLAEFFGDQLPGRHMKKQNIITGTPSETSDSVVHSEVYGEENNEFELLGTVNELTPAEKLILTKRAKKLLGLLGHDVDSKVMAQTQGQIHGTILEASESSLSPLSSTSSPTSEDNDSNVRIAHKQKLDKLSHVMGERISEEQIHDELPAQVARPLTEREKKLYQKKNSKLERVFGNVVPADNVINYGTELADTDADSITAIPTATATETDSSVSESDLHSSRALEEERKNQVVRLRKLKKMFGIHDSSQPLSDEAIKQIEESIMKNVVDESDRQSLFEDLNKLKGKNAASPQVFSRRFSYFSQ